MDAYEVQNLSCLTEATARPDDCIGKLFDEADGDGEAAALVAGAGRVTTFNAHGCPLPIRACRALVYRLLGLGDYRQHSGEDRLHGETACGAARVPRGGCSAAARRDGSTARWPRGLRRRGDRGVGSVEVFEKTFRALRNCLLGLRPRSCRRKKRLALTE